MVKREVRTNSPLAIIAGAFVRAFEKASIRGAPTILRFLSAVFPVRDTLATVRLKSGELMTFPAFDHYWSRHIWAAAPYELDVEQIFRKIGANRVLIDCGANIGYWSVRAKEFGFTSVIAIEANRDLIPVLKENYRLNGVVGPVHHAAVYSTSGEKLFLDHTEAHAQAGLGQKGMAVTSMTIKDAMKDVPGQQEVVVKLDVEGAEIPAFEGAWGVANAFFVYEDFLRKDMAVTRYLLQHGMAIYGVTSSGRHRRISTIEEAAAFSSENSVPSGPSNLVACQPDRAKQLEEELSSH